MRIVDYAKCIREVVRKRMSQATGTGKKPAKLLIASLKFSCV